MIGYIVALLPLYVLVYLPLSHMFNGSSQRTVKLGVMSMNESFIATDEPISCPGHSFNPHILSHEPLVIYIEEFLSDSESQHLLEIRYSRLQCIPTAPPAYYDQSST
jgi:prolyl 4-hydroxylase